MKWRHWILLSIVLVAVAARLPMLLHAGLWRDEAYTYIDVSAGSFSEFWHRFSATEYHPPLFFLLMYGWTRIAGFSEVALKAPAFAFGIALVPAIYRLGVRADSVTAGLLAASLYALAPQAILLSSEVQPYTMAALACTLVAIVALRAHQQPVRRNLVLVAVAMTLFAYTHYIALIACAAFVIVFALAHRTAARPFAVPAALIAGLLPFALWLPRLIHQIGMGTPWLEVPSAAERAAFFPDSLLQGAPVGVLPLQELFWLFVVAALVAAAARDGSIPQNGLLLAGVFVAAIFLESAEGLHALRYDLVFSPLLWVFFATAICRLWNLSKWVQYAAAALLITAVAWPDVAFALRSGSPPKSGIRALSVHDSHAAATLFVIAPDYMTATFAYYFRDRPVAYRGFARSVHPEIFRAAQYAADWRAPGVVDSASVAIEAQARPYRDLVVVVDSKARDHNVLPYGKVWQLLRVLRARYRFLERTDYPARYEKVSEYRFAAGGSR